MTKLRDTINNFPNINHIINNVCYTRPTFKDANWCCDWRYKLYYFRDIYRIHTLMVYTLSSHELWYPPMFTNVVQSFFL